MVNESEYNLMTKARRKVMGRNNQLDEGAGAGRQTWKWNYPLNCVALHNKNDKYNNNTFRKLGTWVQTWT